MNIETKYESSFVALLLTVCLQNPSQIRVDSLADLAKQVWYGEIDLAPPLQHVLASTQRNAEEQRRVLYLIDRLIRFPCIRRSRAMRLKGILEQWAQLKPLHPSDDAARLFAEHKLDKRAFEWGLEEGVSLQMKEVLKYQTRHYAASLGVTTGYSEQ
ncbi:hypothetical protein [Pseudomonas sp. W15Feb9B]|uniref:hypothetical protein n=1 Tax=Pseudomonas sp. W15Feb9B TaxID=550743 RepID=UPI0005972CF4|nr:hypothetical protein [Pseudomonas sp. W15Feb9B]KIK83130.1 hypothetical protein OC71_25140 [Pseudomonas sp. W15Feb9B]